MNKFKNLTDKVKLNKRSASLAVLATFGVGMLISGSGISYAAASSTMSAATQQQHLQNIITKGNAEINRRQATLATLTTKINGATKLTASDKLTLSDEVSSTSSGLTTLEAQLDATTTLSIAKSEAQDIYTEYRVYALLAPKVGLIKVADDQQVVEGKLTALSTKLQTRITADQAAGKNVASLQAQLGSMIASTNSAESISSNIESTVIGLQPSDYNSNHSILEGDNTQLKTAHDDNMDAYNDAKQIVSSLKSL